MRRAKILLRIVFGCALVVLPVCGVAQVNSFLFASPAKRIAASHRSAANAINSQVTNPIGEQLKPSEFGALVQGGFGLTQGRGNFSFFMVGLHAGKVLTATFGQGLLRGNLEYAVEAFPLWESYTPRSLRQNCISLLGASGARQASCSKPFAIGGRFTGVSVTPIILRWNFAGTRRISPWVQGAGGMIWTNHKYPAVGGPPVTAGGITNSSIGNNGPNDDSSVWNFSPQFGVGAHYFVAPNRSIDLGANAIHISSASLGDRNPGVNASVQFTVGYSWWK